MNNDDTSREPVPAPAPAPRPATRPATPASGARGGALALAVLLSIAAAAGAGYVGWQQWQQSRGRAAAADRLAQLDTRVATLETSLKALDDDRRALGARLRDADDVNRGLREEVLGQSERLRNLEDAVAKLSEKSLSSHDAMLLDETESLLRMGKERYELFHDAAGAAAAYGLADQALSGVDDAAFGSLRQSVAAEREALDRAASTQDGMALGKLQQLRGQLGSLPLHPLDTPSPATGAAGVWARIGQALSSVVRIERDDGAPTVVADARLARELVALDLAGAEAALLAHDDAAYHAALQRADDGLAAQFDGDAAPVKAARATLAGLLKASPAQPVELGEALTELRNLRAVHALKPTASGGNGKPATAGVRP